MTQLKAIRAKCMDCSGTWKAVKFCTMDGVNSTRCALWPFRFGVSPKTARKHFGDRFLDPDAMPSAQEGLESVG